MRKTEKSFRLIAGFVLLMTSSSFAESVTIQPLVDEPSAASTAGSETAIPVPEAPPRPPPTLLAPDAAFAYLSRHGVSPEIVRLWANIDRFIALPGTWQLAVWSDDEFGLRIDENASRVPSLQERQKLMDGYSRILEYGFDFPGNRDHLDYVSLYLRWTNARIRLFLETDCRDNNRQGMFEDTSLALDQLALAMSVPIKLLPDGNINNFIPLQQGSAAKWILDLLPEHNVFSSEQNHQLLQKLEIVEVRYWQTANDFEKISPTLDAYMARNNLNPESFSPWMSRIGGIIQEWKAYLSQAEATPDLSSTNTAAEKAQQESAAEPKREQRETRVYTVGPLQTIDDDAIDAVMRKLQAEVKDKDETTILIIANPDCLFKDVSALIKRIKSEGYRKIRLQAPPESANRSHAGATRESTVPQ